MNEALFLSLRVLAYAVPLLLVLGGALGWLLSRRRFRGRDLLSVFLQLPIILPPSVLGFYLLYGMGSIPFFREHHILFAFPATVIGGLTPALPIMIQAARAAFSGVDRDLEDATRTLGVGEWRIFFRVTLPLSRRMLLTGLALSSARVLGDFGVTLMIAGNMPGRTQTLPLYIYRQVESLNFGAAHVAAGILVAVGIACLAAVRRMETNRHERMV